MTTTDDRLVTTELPWLAPDPFCRSVEVLPEHCDGFGHANNVVYLSWLEAAAWAHTDALGMTMEVFERTQCACVARRHELDYLAPTFAGDQLVVGTWLARMVSRVELWRIYQIIRLSDRRPVMQARTRWISIDMRSGRPKRMSPEMQAAYQRAPIDDPFASLLAVDRA